jgi:hypothetical protein
MTKIQNGDKVKLFNCAEAELYPNIIFDVISDPWELGHGREVIRITSKEKDFRGGFAVDKLKKINS